jgi:multidrug efflux pump subunit AcrB
MVSPFRIILVFALLSVAAWFILPSLKVDLLPQEKPAILTVSFTLPKSSPDIAEQQVTSVLEGACSQISQLKKIRSVSGYNNGYIQLYFDETTDLQYKRLELAAIIRQVYPGLPGGCSYPLIIQGTSGANVENALLAYSVNAPLQPYRIKQETEEIFRKAFAGFPEIQEARVSGTEGLQLTVNFDKDKCTAWRIDPAQVISSIQLRFSDSWPGSVSTGTGEEYFLRLPPQSGSAESAGNIMLTNTNGEMVRLKDIARLSIEEQEPQRYFRINGKNSVTLSLFAREGENRITAAKKAKEVISSAGAQLPDGFELVLEYDDTEFIEKEIKKNYQRAGFSALILVFFILLVYRSWRHLINLICGLFATLCITLILTWFFGVDIHLYSIAGLAISFGIITDNSIVMIDYYRQRQNRKIILALLASSCCTIAALCLVFLLPAEEKKDLADFAAIIVLALIASLATALWLTPGLYDLLYGTKRVPAAIKKTSTRHKKRLTIKMLYIYSALLFFIARFRKVFVLLLILAFGLPVFLLPSKWENDGMLARWYNKSIGSEYYQEKVKPGVDKWLGGTLRLFHKNLYENSGYRSPEKTRLYVNAELPYGTTVKQMNAVLSEFEHYLAGENGIERFITSIYSGQAGSIEIIFEEDAEAAGLVQTGKYMVWGRLLPTMGRKKFRHSKFY